MSKFNHASAAKYFELPLGEADEHSETDEGLFTHRHRLLCHNWVMTKEDLKRKSQSLRRNATPEENKLWYQYLRSYPVQFYRQKVIGNYIVDFYCHKAHLVVEIDGGQHFEDASIKYDEERTIFLNGLGIEVLRFTNDEVRNNFTEVCHSLDEKVRTRLRD